MEIALPTVDGLGALEHYLTGQLQRVADDFHDAIERLSGAIPKLTQWEGEHLLDSPTPEELAAHKASVERLLSFAQFATKATAEPTFIRHETAELLEATVAALKLKLHMWHGPKMSVQRSEAILAECFPNESRA